MTFERFFLDHGPSYWWAKGALLTRAQSSPKLPLRVYLDSGAPNGACDDGDNCDVTDQMAQIMTSKGYDVVRVKVDGAEHDWQYWRARLAGMLTHFRDKQTVCD